MVQNKGGLMVHLLPFFSIFFSNVIKVFDTVNHKDDCCGDTCNTKNDEHNHETDSNTWIWRKVDVDIIGPAVEILGNDPNIFIHKSLITELPDTWICSAFISGTSIHDPARIAHTDRQVCIDVLQAADNEVGIVI